MNVKKSAGAAVFLCALFSLHAADSGAPGSFENAAPAAMKEVLALDAKLNPSSDEFVVYYVRPDKKYEKWALWMWALPGGDGGANWQYTQNWTVRDGIGYMRFKTDGSSTGGQKIFSSDGRVGLIVRQKDEWVKDCPEDRVWNSSVSQKVVIFSDDQTTYAAADYKPAVKSAELVSEKEIKITLSGRYGLDLDGGESGFSVVTAAGKEYKIEKVYNTSQPNNPGANMTAEVTVLLSEPADIADSLVLKNAAFLADAAVSSARLAVQIAETRIPPAGTVLGCVFDGGAASFSLWAPTSSSAVLNLYRTGDAESPDFTVPMTFDARTGVWKATFDSENPDGFFYDYTLHNAKGVVTVLDPYALSMSANRGKGGAGRAAVVNMKSDKAGVQESSYVKLAKREDAVIYEVSVRDFTISPDSGVSSMPGTYSAFIEKIPYLKKLGITHVQLMPVLNFYFNDETDKSYEDSGTVSNNNYNWGYDPHNYFTPEGWYATDASDPYCRIRELRALIDECHKAGIGVLLDVVYNHMAGIQFLDDIVPGYYFRTDEKGSLKSNSGCGNDTATERTMMKRLVIDSTAHWVRNYKADGFRFDLMGLMEASSVIDSYKACAKLNPSVLFEGEGWKMYNGAPGTLGMDQNYMLKTDKVAVFNDEFRDVMKAGGFNETGRGLITKKAADSTRFFRNVTGNPMSNYHADQPGDNLNYLVCHDGLTLHDAVVHNLRLDEQKDRREIISRLKLGNFIELTSQGIAFLHAGQERGRTKPNLKHAKNETIGNFVRNSYDSSDNINQIVWTIDDDYQGLFDYTAGLVGIRNAFGVFRLASAKNIARNISMLEADDGSGLAHGYVIKNGKEKWFVLINANSKTIEFNAGVSLDNGVIYVDSEVADKNGIESPVGVKISGKNVVLEPLTATIIRIK